MSTADPLVRESLLRLLPPLDDARPDWPDVLGRARPAGGGLPEFRPRRRRLLAVAAVGALAIGLGASPFGGAVVRLGSDVLHRFGDWASDAPGEPAPAEEQERFESASQNALFGFPEGTQLRVLLSKEVAGTHYDLLGFRAGDQLCLRLVRRGAAGSNPTDCQQLRALEKGPPVAVAIADHGFGRQNVPPSEDGYVPSETSATFGFAADGIVTVELAGDEGIERVPVARNAFLSVVERPRLGSRVRRIVGVDAEGSRHPVPFAETMFGEDWRLAEPIDLGGPTRVERKLDGGTIGWLEQREPRGEALPDRPPARNLFSHWGKRIFARVLRPTPGSPLRILVFIIEPHGRGPFNGAPGLRVCFGHARSFGGVGGGCSPFKTMFDQAPVQPSLSQEDGGRQFSTLSGLVSDDVARLELFRAGGGSEDVPLVDNAFAADIRRTLFPVKLVAYDAQGRSVWIERMEGLDVTTNPSLPEGKRRKILEVRGENGSTTTISVSPSTTGGRCWWTRTAGGAGGHGCLPPGFAVPVLSFNLTPTGPDSARDDVFLSAEVSARVVSLDLRFQDGATVEIPLVERFGLYAVPVDRFAPGRRPEVLFARDADGRAVARQALPASGPGVWPR